MNRMPKPVSLRTILVVPLVVQTTVIVTLIGYLSYRSGQHTVADLANQLLEETLIRTDEKLTHYLEQPHLINQLNVNAVQLGELDVRNLDQVEQHLLRQLGQFPPMRTVLFGAPNGDFRIIHRNGLEGDRLEVGRSIPNQPDRLQVYGVDSTGQITEPYEMLAPFPEGDRLSYEAAVRQGQPGWSEPFQIGDDPGLLLNAYTPVYGDAHQLVGVFSVNLSLADIDAYLQDLELGRFGAVLILDADGALIASSLPESLMPSDGQLTQRQPSHQSHNPLVAEVGAYLQQHPEIFVHPTSHQVQLIQGERMFFQTQPIRDANGLDWHVVVMVPESHFTTVIDANLRRTVGLCAIALGVSAVSGALLSRWVTRPLLRLHQASQAFPSHPDHFVLPQSGVREVDALVLSFHQMTTQLQTSFEALQTSEAKLATLLDSVPIGVSVFDTQGRLILMNRAGQDLLGHRQTPQENAPTLQDVAAKAERTWNTNGLFPDTESYPSLAFEQVYRAGTDQPYLPDELPTHRALRGETVYCDDLELRVQGDRIVLEVFTTPVRDAKGAVVYAIHAFQDIRERRRLEQLHTQYEQQLEQQIARHTKTLQESEARFRSAFDDAGTGMSIMALDGRFLQVNRALCTLLDYSPEEFAQMTFHVVAHPDELDDFQVRLQSLLMGDRCTYQLEKRCRHRQGHFVWGLLSLSLVRDDQGQPHYFVCQVQNISDRKQAELALQESEAINRAIKNALPDLLMRMKADGTCIDVKPSRHAPIVRSPEFMKGQNIRDWLTETDVQQRLDAAQRAIATNEEQSYIFSFQQDQQTYWRETRVVPLKDDEVLVVVRDITQQRQAEESLLKQEAENRALIGAIPDLLIQMRRDGTYVKVKSPTNHFPLIMNSQAMVGRTVDEILPPHLAKQRILVAQKALETGKIQTYEFPVIIQGQNCWQEARIVPLDRDEVLVMVRDLTARKQMEQALKQSEQTNRAMLRAIPDLVIRVDAQGNYLAIFSGESVRQINPDKAVVGNNIADVLPLPIANLWQALIQKALLTGDLQISEYEIEIDALVDYEEVRVVPIRNQEVLIMVRNMTPQKQAEERLKSAVEREQAIARIVEHMHQSLEMERIFAATVQEVQQALRCDRILIYRFLPDWSGEIVAEVVTPGWQPMLKDPDIPHHHYVTHNRCRVRAMHQSGQIFTDSYLQSDEGMAFRQMPHVLVNHHVTQSGFEPCYLELMQQLQAEAYAIAPIVKHGKLWGLIAAYHNSAPHAWEEAELNILTHTATQLSIALQQAELLAELRQKTLELQRARDAAEAANHAKSTFLASMSHELRTPLNVILGFAQVMQHDLNLTPDQSESLQLILQSGDHLLSLINNVLDLSKIEAGRTSLDPTSFDVMDFVRSLHDMFRQRAEVKGLTLKLEVDPSLPPYITTDANKLRQILINLLGNALKFTEKGMIALRIRVLDSDISSNMAKPASDSPHRMIHLAFEVEDTGVGISVEDQAKVFQAFEQSQSGKNQGGTGLGLTLCQQFVAMLGGDISLVSQIDRGSVFCVTLPVQVADSADQSAELDELTITGLHPSSGRPRILIVDDQVENRIFLVQALRQLGFEVQEAVNGIDALAQWQEWQPDLIVMDLHMPGMDGYETTRQIRQAEEGGQTILAVPQDGVPVPIIALTASTFPADRMQAQEAGCDSFIGKPVQLKVLLEAIALHVNVTYCYEKTANLASAPSMYAPGGLAVEDLYLMPADWVRQLHHAAMTCRDTLIEELIQQIPPDLAELKEGLSYYNYNLRLDYILQLTETYHALVQSGDRP
jgi:two-component system sensor histidine kinase/response regulator